MKRITCMIFLLCTVFVLSAQESAKTLVVDLKSHETKKVLVVAHRGDWRMHLKTHYRPFKIVLRWELT